MTTVQQNLRNIAIIAHVDHGKTTLVDAMLRQSHVFRDNQPVVERVLDSNDLERERGITILAKNAAITYRGVKINLVDTPGHADFGGEVERVLNMVDGVLLLVDAVDGPMPQTRFVLRKALELGHKAIVVINKVDRANAQLDYVANATFDLFVDLGASDAQAEFPIVYTDAVRGQASLSPATAGVDLQPLFDTILADIPAPRVEPEGPAQMLVTSLAYDDYKGRIAIGRLFAGSLSRAQPVVRIAVDGQTFPGKIAQLFVHQGLERLEVERAEAGEIIAVTGLAEVFIGETIADAGRPSPLPPIRVEAPTVQMAFGVNTSPFAGREGTWSTSRKLRERLFKELEHNVSLRVQETDNSDTFIVSGRGELHLVILIETMRREGYEFQVGKPEVIMRRDNGRLLEPVEEVYIEVPEDMMGTVVELLGNRRGQLLDVRHGERGTVYLTYLVSTRGLLGFRGAFITVTRGAGILHALFHGYQPAGGEITQRERGSIVAWEQGVTTAYALHNAEERGSLFIGPGVEVYEGMIVGQHARPGDMPINVCKKKHLTNVRSSTEDIMVRLTPPRQLSLDDCIEYVGDDELLEVTPLNLRLRKRILGTELRRKTAAGRDMSALEPSRRLHNLPARAG
jgi:GTP-binding protein